MNRLISISVALIFCACGGSKQISTIPEVEFRELDTLFVSASQETDEPAVSLERYNAAYEKDHDLLHTRLEIEFDWEKQQVHGKAWLKLTPYFYTTDKLRLDAVNFDIHKIEVVGSSKEILYEYNGWEAQIQLDKGYKRGETFDLFVEYTATPRFDPGSSTPTREQGLFFINPNGEVKNKPTQIWTQGETEYNSRWFPTIDKPNERCTQELSLTVKDQYKTLSNGLLISSVINSDGTRTDYWKMDQPHAPYLFMVAVGDYAVVKDEWKGKEVSYYVEPPYEQDARDIFSNTPEMLDFFSRKLGVEYPWDKYSQVVVRDFVAGAMENTTGVTFAEFVQKSKRDLIDNHNERIVAHEMFHHWFGDLVTCESWANLTMNEGFANYSEYLWYEHKYGLDAASHLLKGDALGYFHSASREMHPLIHFGYEDKEDMFDSHSYNKGACILHMLRTTVGDEAFFASLNKYLNDNAFSSVEAHDLRLAFEEVTGKDLNWFFNQWFYDSGHPILNIDYDYIESEGKAKVIIEQTQDPGLSTPIFILPMKVDLYLASDLILREEVVINQRKQEFEFEVPNKPILINVDADNALLAVINDNKKEEALAFEYFHASGYLDRFDAVAVLQKSESELSKKVMTAALNDSFWYLRREAVRYFEEICPELAVKFEEMAKEDEKSQVRAAALERLSELENTNYTQLATGLINESQPYRVVANALRLLNVSDPEIALKYAKKLEQEQNETLLSTISELYLRNPSKDQLPFFKATIERIEGYGAIDFFNSYAEASMALGEKVTHDAISRFYAIATNFEQSPYRRYSATKSLSIIKKEIVNKAEIDQNEAKQIAKSVEEKLEAIKRQEPNEWLKSRYNQF